MKNKKNKVVKTPRMLVEKFVDVPRKRQDAFWYKGYTLLAKITDTRTGLYALVSPAGDIRVQFEDDGEIFENNEAVQEAERLGYTDEDIINWNWVNNNWFEIRLYRDKKHISISSGRDVGHYPVLLPVNCDVEYTVKDAIHSAKLALKEFKDTK
jgi:hypothetical protein